MSAKVFVDKTSFRSKCFGFVGFDKPVSAHNAIAGMNDFVLEGKPLRVQFKTPKGVPGRPF